MSEKSEEQKTEFKLAYFPKICAAVSSIPILGFLIVILVVFVGDAHPYAFFIYGALCGIMFGVGIIVSIIISIIVFNIQKKKRIARKITCPTCQVKHEPSTEFCSYCGTDLTVTETS
ncbi:MAG: hypothetical protein GNW80_03170 [Asgard group archaeon]|nr:hypothetical protein [Asgard group archaeon]